MNKKMYLKNLNIYVLRQIDSKINTTTMSMSIISLLLFLTICIFSSAISLNNTMNTGLKKYAPIDITLTQMGEENPIGIEGALKEIGVDPKENFSEYVISDMYQTNQLTSRIFMEEEVEQIQATFPLLNLDKDENIMTVSDYNKIAKMYGNDQVVLKENEYILICNYDQMKEIRDMVLQKDGTITINGSKYHSKYKECQDGVTSISPQPLETGTFIVPDHVVKQEWKTKSILNANYKGETEAEKQKIEDKIANASEDETINIAIIKNISALTKIEIYDSSVGLSATATFIGLYLGIIFLISSAAILALKELSDSSDNKERYMVLRKIGADEKMIYGALFKQIGIFFIFPLLLAMIHSIFGLKVAGIMLSIFGKQDLMGSIIATAIFIILIYGGYFVATYFGSKNIIKDTK